MNIRVSKNLNGEMKSMDGSPEHEAELNSNMH